MIRPFCWHQNFVPWGLLSLPRGYIRVLNHGKKMYKIGLQNHVFFFKFATNEWSDKTFILTSKLCPLGAVCSCPGGIYMYKIMKKLYEIRLQRDFFKLATNDRSDKMFLLTLLTLKFCPQGVVCPCPGAIYMYKIMKKEEEEKKEKCIKSDIEEICLNLEANDRSDKRFLLRSQNFPLGLSASDLRLCTFIKSWKDVYKVRSWRDSF